MAGQGGDAIGLPINKRFLTSRLPCPMLALCIVSDRRACRVVGIVSGIVPGVNRNSGESLAIGFAVADENGGIGIVRHY